MPFKTLFAVALGLALLYGWFMYGAPFLLALVMANLLEPFVQMGMKFNRISRQMSAILVCTLFSLLMLGFSYGIGNRIVLEIISFIKNVPAHWEDPDGMIQQVTDRIQGTVESFSPQLADQIRAGLGTALKSLSGLFTGISGFVFSLAAKIPNMLISLIVFLMALYLISMNLPAVKRSFLSLFEEQTRAKMDTVLGSMRKAISGFIVAQLILSLITFVIVFTGLMILHPGYELALATLVTVVDILPVLGTGSVLVPWALYSLATGDNILGTGLLVIFAVTNIVRRIVEPKILGNAVGIGSLSALVSLFIGFKLIGVAGLFLGPAVVILFQAMRQVGLLTIKIKLE